jgi:hypothetical protein
MKVTQLKPQHQALINRRKTRNEELEERGIIRANTFLKGGREITVVKASR